jgi:hypothetical protein
VDKVVQMGAVEGKRLVVPMGASSIDLGKEHATEGKAGRDEGEEDVGEKHS